MDRTITWLPLAFTLALAAGCEDIRRLEGEWAGPLSADPAHQQGFPAGAMMRATVTSVSRRQIELTIDLPPSGPLPFQPIRHAADDALGDLRLDGEPLRTFLGYLRPPVGESFLAVVSLFSEERIDVRIIRGPDETYGVFALRRPAPPEKSALEANDRPASGVYQTR
jgi:hypothetical protein